MISAKVSIFEVESKRFCYFLLFLIFPNEDLLIDEKECKRSKFLVLTCARHGIRSLYYPCRSSDQCIYAEKKGAGNSSWETSRIGKYQKVQVPRLV